jgi:hypothetical protein
MAYHTPALRRQGVHWWLRYPHDHAPGRIIGKDARREGCARICRGRDSRIAIRERRRLLYVSMSTRLMNVPYQCDHEGRQSSDLSD